MMLEIKEDDLIEVMWYECGQTKRIAYGKWTCIFSCFDNGLDYECKNDTAMVSWKELMSPKTCAVWPKFHHAKDNRINLSMFRTPFILQGTELRPGSDLIMMWRPEDDNDGQ